MGGGASLIEGVGKASVIDAGRQVISSFWLIFVSLIEKTILSSACDEMGFALPRLEDRLSSDDCPE